MILLWTKENCIAKIKIKNLGYDTLHVTSFEKMIELLRNNPTINLLIIDVDSFDNVIIFLEEILAIKNIPIIYLTSKHERSLDEKYNNTACYGYLYSNSNNFVFDSTIKMAFSFFEKNKKLKKLEGQLKKGEIEYQNIFKNHHAIMLIINPKTGDIIRANLAASNFYGWSQKELRNMNIRDINTLTKEQVKAKMQLANSKNKAQFFFKHKLSDGTIKDVEVHSGSMMIEGNKMLFSIIYDITERKQAEKKIKYFAYFDSLTSLPNRKMFSEKLNQAILNSEKNNLKFALFFMDLDSFKNVNDSFGHLIGDQLLINVAKRLKKSLRKDSKIFRLGGDEFAIIVEDITTYQKISIICNRILKELEKPFILNNNEVSSSVSIGISIYPDNGLDAKTILKNSDKAMYNVKKSGKRGYKFYSSEII
ncbi:diguanylate cyclase domain-containing protein [Psychrilyobacter atlanticus]|uniref:diguanylate cyclase domain-containing protein n=1 Tax=Psychrilyobacter atlanticus TaxID=271091 RepID=UPI00042267F2|nr:diguanylate cyclase [Psychrilyobacter atlanticus]